MSSLQFLIADDHPVIRRRLRTLIESRPDWKVSGEAADGVEAVEQARILKPDVILLDVTMPRMNGLDAARLIQQLAPGSQILIVSQNDPVLMRKAATEVGAKGFVPKSNVAQELVRSVEGLIKNGTGSHGGHSTPVPVWDNDDNGKSRLAVARVRGQAAELERKERLDAEMLAAIVSSSDDAIISKNLDGIITTWNKGAERIFGYTAEEAIGQPITLLIPPDRLNEEYDILARLRRGEQVDHFETVRMRKDGTLLDISVTISPLRNSAGIVIGASKVARDITLQKHAEEALRESEERLRALVNASSYVVYRISPDWKEMRQLDGSGVISEAENPTIGWLQNYIHPDDQPKLLQKIQNAIRDKSLFEFEHRVRRSDGSLGWTLSRAVPVLDAKGEILEWFGAASDVTPRKQAEENYRKLVETLDSEVRARTRQLEQRNADVLRHSDQLRDLSQRLLQARDEERRHVARELHDSAGQTLTVLGMNLAMLAQEAHKFAPEFAHKVDETQGLVQQLSQEIRTTSYLLHPPLLDENGLISALTWYIEGLADRSGLDVQLKVPADFGRIPRDMELVVFRLVQECLTNIHRHSGATSALIQIERRNGEVSVQVQDNGRGMPPEKLAEVQSGGSGVGLRGLRERVRRFQGTLRIESDASGTRVLVSMPVPKHDVTESMQTGST
jgi:PAS domain S-box-containing protein